MLQTSSESALTGEWENHFFSAFAHHGSVLDGCAAVGVARKTVYKRKANDPEFAARWAEAEEMAIESLEREAHRRAMEMSDTLLIFLLKCRKPSVYGQRVNVEIEGGMGIEVIHRYPKAIGMEEMTIEVDHKDVS